MKKGHTFLVLVVLVTVGTAQADPSQSGETPADRAKKSVPYVDTIVRFDWPNGGTGAFGAYLRQVPPSPTSFPADPERRTEPIRQGLTGDGQFSSTPEYRSMIAAAKGLTAFEKGDYAKSDAAYTEAIGIEPNEPEHHLNRAQVRLVLGQTDEAMHDFERAIQLDPKKAGAYREYRAQTWFWLGQPDKARADIEDAIRLEPDVAQNYLTRTMLRCSKKDYDGALADYDHAIRLDPESRGCFPSPLFLIHILRRDGKAAIASLEEFVPGPTTPERKTYDASKICLLCAIGEHDKAIVMADDFIVTNPKEPAPLLLRAMCLVGRKDYDRARDDCNAALKRKPRWAEAYYLRSRTWTGKRNFQETLRDLNAALEITPDLVDALNSKAWLLATCTDPSIRDGQAAVECARRAVSLQRSEDSYFFGTLAAALAEHGDFAKAIRTQQKAISLIDDPKARYLEGFRKRLALYQQKTPYREKVDDNGDEMSHINNTESVRDTMP